MLLMSFDQPYTNHNGGMIAFGPDGYLYIAVGDGGSGGDPLQHGQDLTTLLGTILRIDVDSPAGNFNYGIPSDNPFVGNFSGYREEIFAYGLRNPWRFSIDFMSGEIWAGDVGQNRIEEINLIMSGGNYGWRITEGNECFNPSDFNNPLSSCNRTGLIDPVKQYSQGQDCSVTGGYIYRGSRQPDLNGAYIYGDFCSGKIWMLRALNGNIQVDQLLTDSNTSLSSFGVDEQNELYIVSLGGSIYKFSM
jgi:glucose/arabinose dehydrogenase